MTDLPRRLGFMDATTVVVGSMIGSGIFLKASAIAQKLPNPYLVMLLWIAAGLLTLFGALAYAELGAMYPQSGGLYVYLARAYGPFVAFLFGWSMLAILQTGSIAGLAAGVSQALGDERVLHLGPRAQMLLAGWLVVLFSALNLVSVRAVAGVQNLFTGAKTLGLLLLIFGGFCYAGGSFSNFHSEQAVASAGLLAVCSNFGFAMVKALWAYDGWINGTFVAGEVREPQRNMPRALIFGTLLVIVIYVLANTSYHYALPLEQVQSSASAAGSGVAATVAQLVLPASGALLMALLIAISTLGTLNSSVLSGPRVYYAMARDRLFFPMVAAVHPRYLTPHVAILLQCAWALALLLVWKTFDPITDNVMFIFWIFYALGAAAVIILRLRQPSLDRPYRTFGYPAVPVIFILVSILLTLNSIYQLGAQALESLALVGIGALIYPIFKGGLTANE